MKTEQPTTTGALRVRYGTGPSLIGSLFVATTDRGVCAIYLLADDDPAPGLARLRRDVPRADPVADPDVAAALIPRIIAYLSAGAPHDGLALDLQGTPFQLRVWEALAAIPWGTTTTYGALAVSMGLPPGAARAVGTACGANPVSLIVPCHRVLRAGGALGGYGWGLPMKQALLDLEASGVASSAAGPAHAGGRVRGS